MCVLYRKLGILQNRKLLVFPAGQTKVTFILTLVFVIALFCEFGLRQPAVFRLRSCCQRPLPASHLVITDDRPLLSVPVVPVYQRRGAHPVLQCSVIQLPFDVIIISYDRGRMLYYRRASAYYRGESSHGNSSNFTVLSS
jgi:hypothetical protein